MTNLLILDGISGVPLAQELTEAFLQNGVNATYADLRKFEAKPLYSMRAAYHKALNKRENADGFYHFPKLREQAFETYISKLKPKNILVVGFVYKYLSPEFLIKLKKQYEFSLYLYDTDSCNLYEKRREFIFFIENELVIYDRIFSFSQVTTRFFRETKNLPAEFVPYGAKALPAANLANQEADVLFVGSADLRRIFLLEHIREVVTIFGDRWSRNLPLVSVELKSKINDGGIWGEALLKELHRHKIILNITRTPFYGAETGVNLRIFEALAAGCFVLTDYCDELAEIFEIGKEIEVFRSASELAEKVEYYLNNPEKRIAIAHYGREKFLREHAWTFRATELMQKINHQKSV